MFAATLKTFDRQKQEVKLRFQVVQSQPFRTKWASITQNWGKIAISQPPQGSFRTKWGSIAKNWSKIAILNVPQLVCKSARV